VPVPGNEGKAGMAAIVSESLGESELSILFDILTKNLQKHSRPIFIRHVAQIPKTANFKNKKLELVAESFNATDVFVLQGKTYVALTDRLVQELNSDIK
jgi:hypothetical protein